MKYRQLQEGEWVIPIRRGYKAACCDCGLVHRIDFRLFRHRGKVELAIRAFRDNRATAAKRRKKSQ